MRLGPHLKRPPGGNQVLDADYSDLESVELTNGEYLIMMLKQKASLMNTEMNNLHIS